MEIGNIILESFFQVKMRLEHEHYGSGRMEAYLREDIFIEAHRFLMSMPMSPTHRGGHHSRERFEYKGIMFFNNKYQLSFLGLERHRLIVPLAYIDLAQVIAFFMEVNDYCQIPIFVIETGEVASYIPERPRPFSDDGETPTESFKVTSVGGKAPGSISEEFLHRKVKDIPDSIKDFKIEFPETWKPTMDEPPRVTHIEPRIKFDEESMKKLAEEFGKIKPPETKGSSSLFDSLKIWKDIANGDKKV